MSLNKKIMKAIDASILDLHLLLVERFGLDKYGIDKDDLLQAWKEASTAKSKGKKPKSAYQAFAAEQRVLLKQENPAITFGQIATETSKRWKLLDADEKAAYAVGKKSPVVHEAASPVGHKSKTKAELLKVAESMGLELPKSTTKNKIMEAIKEAEEVEESASSASEIAESPVAVSEASPVDTTKLIESENEESPVVSEEEEEDELEKYKAMKTKDLSALCKEKGLASTGNKEVLIRRLLHN